MLVLHAQRNLTPDLSLLLANSCVAFPGYNTRCYAETAPTRMIPRPHDAAVLSTVKSNFSTFGKK